MKRICIVYHWIWKATIFEVKGQLKVKLIKSSNFIWKIINFHLINLVMRQQLQSASLNLETNYFWGQRSTQGQTSKIINFNLKNNQFSSDWLELRLKLWIWIFMKWTIWCIHGNLWRGGWILQVSCCARRLFLVSFFNES